MNSLKRELAIFDQPILFSAPGVREKCSTFLIWSKRRSTQGHEVAWGLDSWSSACHCRCQKKTESNVFFFFSRNKILTTFPFAERGKSKRITRSHDVFRGCYPSITLLLPVASTFPTWTNQFWEGYWLPSRITNACCTLPLGSRSLRCNRRVGFSFFYLLNRRSM